jgi:hypothetical protein
LKVCASSNDSCVNEAEINSSSQVEGSGSRKQGKMKHGEEAQNGSTNTTSEHAANTSMASNRHKQNNAPVACAIDLRGLI